MQLCLGANEVGERGANEVPKFILSYQQSHHHPYQHQQHQPAPTEPPARGPAPPPPARTTRTTTSTMANSSSTTSSTGTNNTSTMTTPAQPSAPTQRPAQPAPASLAAVPPPAPAPHAGICSVHVSMYAQDSKIYSYILQNKKMLARRFLNLHMFAMLTAVRYTAHKQICIHKQIARMQTLENWKWKRMEKEQSIAHNTNMTWTTKVYAKSHQNTADTQTDTSSPQATRLKATLVM